MTELGVLNLTHPTKGKATVTAQVDTLHRINVVRDQGRNEHASLVDRKIFDGLLTMLVDGLVDDGYTITDGDVVMFGGTCRMKLTAIAA